MHVYVFEHRHAMLHVWPDNLQELIFYFHNGYRNRSYCYAIWKTNTFTLWNISLVRTILLIEDLTKILVCIQTVNCKYFFVEGIYVNKFSICTVYILNMYCLADYIGFTRIGLINPLNLKMQFMKNEYSK